MRCLATKPSLILASLILCLLTIGCGQRTVIVTGTVLREKKPIALGPTGVLQVTLVPEVVPPEGITTHVGRCDAAGKFEVLDVPLGRYRVAITQLDPTPMDDVLEGAFSQANTKFVREVDGKTPLTIDLAEPGT